MYFMHIFIYTYLGLRVTHCSTHGVLLALHSGTILPSLRGAYGMSRIKLRSAACNTNDLLTVP